MADDNSVSPAGGVKETDSPVTAPAPKKRRAPRQKRVAVELVATEPEPVVAARATRAVRGPGRKPKAAETENGNGKSKAVIKNVARKTPAKPIKQAAAAPAVEIEDLVALEAENKRLRKILAEKLRQENAELRKRLGL